MGRLWPRKRGLAGFKVLVGTAGSNRPEAEADHGAAMGSPRRLLCIDGATRNHAVLSNVKSAPVRLPAGCYATAQSRYLCTLGRGRFSPKVVSILSRPFQAYRRCR